MRHRTWVGACAVIYVLICGVSANAAEPVKGAKPQAAVEFFAAIEAGQLKATVVPRDSTKVTLQLENKTAEPLSINVPGGLTAMPVMAQFGQGFGQGFAQGNGLFAQPNGNNTPQAVGFPFQNNLNNRNGPNQGFPNFNFNQPLAPFNIPPEKTIVVRLPGVCLEYGKPDPQPRMAYEVRPLESFSDNAAIGEMLAYFGAGGCTQREAQLAAWHLSNGMSWDELAKLKIEHLSGRKELRFTAAEVERAKKIVAKLPSHGKAKSVSVATSEGE